MADACVLLLGDHEVRLGEWAERVRALGFRTVRAKTTQDALILAEERGHEFRIALVESDLPAFDLPAALESLRRHPSADRLRFLAFGAEPDPEGRAALRAAGIDHALWEPVGDHTLRFWLNRAFAVDADPHLRGELRVPTEWNTPIFVAGRKKPGSVYSISAVGCFVETARPSMRGAKAVVELPLPSGELRIAGSVVYANVPGNLKRPNLPTGMALRFEEPTPDQVERIREVIAAGADAQRL